MDYVLNLNYADGISLINKGLEKANEENAFRIWLTIYPNMTKDNFIPFDEFYNPKPKTISKKSAEEMLRESMEIRNRLGQKKGGN